MKILHTADWHLGKRLENHSRIAEQRLVMDEIVAIADREQVDMVIIAGDLFDTFNPPIEAEELFYHTLRKLSDGGKRIVVALAGNHDSPDRIEAPDPLARDMGIFFAGYPSIHIKPITLPSGIRITKSEDGFVEIMLPQVNYPVRLLLTPYANEFRLRAYLGEENQEQAMRDMLQQRWAELASRYCYEKGINVLATHLFMMKEGQAAPEEPEDEKPILHVGGAQAVYSSNIPPEIQYTALGHLHRHHHVDKKEKNIWYSGSPLSYSFSEANQDKYVNIAELSPGQPINVVSVKLEKGKRLLRQRFENVEEAVSWLATHQEELVELTMATDDYLTAQDRKTLYKAHPGIITIIPEIKNKVSAASRKTIDLQQSMDNLFELYFRHQHGQSPNEELMALFKEIQAEKDQS